MSYVDLKHLLADLSLEAVRTPDDAKWAAVSAAYAAHASAAMPDVPWEAVRHEAVRLAAPFRWQIDGNALDVLVGRGLLKQRGDQITAASDFADHLEYLKRQAPRLLDVLGELRSGGSHTGSDVWRGIALFNGRLFFECHEYLEGVWKATRGPERDFFHGIVQVAAAFYHFEKRNWHGANTLADKGVRKLAAYPDDYLGVDLDAFRSALKPWIVHFRGRGEHPEPHAYPKIELRTQKRQEAPRG